MLQVCCKANDKTRERGENDWYECVTIESTAVH